MAEYKAWNELLQRWGIIDSSGQSRVPTPFGRVQVGSSQIEAINYGTPEFDQFGIKYGRSVQLWDKISFIIIREGAASPLMKNLPDSDGTKSKWISMLESKGIATNGRITGHIAKISAGAELDTSYFSPYAYDNDFLFLKRGSIEMVIPWDQIENMFF